MKNLKYLFLLLLLILNYSLICQEKQCLNIINANLENVVDKILVYYDIKQSDSILFYCLDDVKIDTNSCKVSFWIAIDSCESEYLLLLSQDRVFYSINSNIYSIANSGKSLNQIFPRDSILSFAEIEIFKNSLLTCDSSHYYDSATGGKVEIKNGMLLFTPYFSLQPTVMISLIK